VGVPTICRFRGVTIAMFFDEAVHLGRPHFHAFYGEHHASFDALGLNRLVGKLPPRIERLVRKWARANRGALLANWERMRQQDDPLPVPPLK
jgi:uncharacterized protein DUF4160